MNQTATFNKCICNLTPEVRDILKILWQKRISPFFHNVFFYLLLDDYV